MEGWQQVECKQTNLVKSRNKHLAGMLKHKQQKIK